MNLPKAYTCILQCEISIKNIGKEEKRDWKISNKNAV